MSLEHTPDFNHSEVPPVEPSFLEGVSERFRKVLLPIIDKSFPQDPEEADVHFDASRIING